MLYLDKDYIERVTKFNDAITRKEKCGDLLDSIQEIAEIIIMEMPLRYQDAWVEKMVKRGLVKSEMLYTPEED